MVGGWVEPGGIRDVSSKIRHDTVTPNSQIPADRPAPIHTTSPFHVLMLRHPCHALGAIHFSAIVPPSVTPNPPACPRSRFLPLVRPGAFSDRVQAIPAGGKVPAPLPFFQTRHASASVETLCALGVPARSIPAFADCTVQPPAPSAPNVQNCAKTVLYLPLE